MNGEQPIKRFGGIRALDRHLGNHPEIRLADRHRCQRLAGVGTCCIGAAFGAGVDNVSF